MSVCSVARRLPLALRATFLVRLQKDVLRQRKREAEAAGSKFTLPQARYISLRRGRRFRKLLDGQRPRDVCVVSVCVCVVTA